MLLTLSITDTDDQSNISIWDFANFLMDLKHGDTSKITIQAIVVPAYLNDPSCQGEQNKPLKIEEVLRIFNGQVFSLCSATYAENLAILSDEIFKKTPEGDYNPGVKLDPIELLGQPNLNTLKVTFGQQVIPKDPKIGWSLGAQNTLIFSQNILWEPQGKGTPIVVSYEIY